MADSFVTCVNVAGSSVWIAIRGRLSTYFPASVFLEESLVVLSHFAKCFDILVKKAHFGVYIGG